jgi:hypothetical protein
MMTYTIEETEQEYIISIFDKKVLFRTHSFPLEVEGIEAIAEVLTNDAEIEKQREGEPK